MNYTFKMESDPEAVKAIEEVANQYPYFDRVLFAGRYHTDIKKASFIIGAYYFEGFGRNCIKANSEDFNEALTAFQEKLEAYFQPKQQAAA